MSDKVILRVAESQDVTVDQDGMPITRRVYFLTASYIGSERYWWDFAHHHVFHCAEKAHTFLEKVQGVLGDHTGAIPATRLANSPHWSRNTELDPMEDEARYGLMWEKKDREMGM